MTPAGQMNRRVRIMRQGGAAGAGAKDSFGQPVTAGAGGWAEVRTPWAKIDPQVAGKTGETYSDGDFTGKVQILVTLRYSKTDRITVADQVWYTEPGNGLQHVYQINSVVNPKQQNEDIVLVCEELNPKV